jgi:hypothetical protein
VDDFDAFIEELKKQPSPAVGELFVFVEENCFLMARQKTLSLRITLAVCLNTRSVPSEYSNDGRLDWLKSRCRHNQYKQTLRTRIDRFWICPLPYGELRFTIV